MIKELILTLLVGFTPLDTDEVYCMVEAIYYEARGESLEGKVAVGNVILNRVYDGAYPDTICDVVRQKHQFSYFWDGKVEDFQHRGQLDEKALIEIIFVAGHLIKGYIEDNTGYSLHYYAHNKVYPFWAEGKQAKVIGNHTFLVEEQ